MCGGKYETEWSYNIHSFLTSGQSCDTELLKTLVSHLTAPVVLLSPLSTSHPFQENAERLLCLQTLSSSLAVSYVHVKHTELIYNIVGPVHPEFPLFLCVLSGWHTRQHLRLIVLKIKHFKWINLVCEYGFFTLLISFKILMSLS